MDAQDMKCNKHNKKGKKSKINNGDAEVFVLPPDLLEKLGINLGTVNSDQQLSSETSIKKDCFDQEEIKNAQSIVLSTTDHTISETASLLKESMLITGSPTLIASESRIAGEIEISSGTVQGHNSIKFAVNSESQVVKDEINGQVIHDYSNSSDKANLKDKDTYISNDQICSGTVVEKILRTDYNESVTVVENHLEEDKDENKNYYDVNDEKKRFLKDRIRNMVKNKYPNVQENVTKGNVALKTSIDSTETIKPLKSLNCSDDLLNDLQINSTKILSPVTTSNVSIVLEEIADTTELHDLKNLKSQNEADLSAVTMKSFVTAIKTEKNGEEIGDTLSLTPAEINNKDPDEYNSHCNIHNSFDTNQKKLNDSLVKECMLNGVHLNVSDNQQNILEEDEIELGDFNNLKNNDCNETLIVNNKITPDVEQHVITAKSKLSFQGVEKPGGDQDTNENINLFKITKTYQKFKRLTKTVINNSTKSTNEAVCVPHEIDTEEINAVITQEESIHPEFCICKDFGILNFYDVIKEYEHVHFWKRDTPYVDAELIYSIYDDEYCNIFGDFDLLSTKMDSEKIDDEVCVKFCWNDYGEMKSDPDYDCLCLQMNVSYDNQHSKKLKKKTPTKNKRKRSTERLASHGVHKPFNRKELDIMINSFEVRSDNYDNMGLLKGKKNDCEILLKNSDNSKKTKNNKELLPINNKESSSDLPVATVTKDVETPPPKRGRGRPKRNVQPTSNTREPKGDEAADLTRVESSPVVNVENKSNSITASENNEHSKSVSMLRVRKDLLEYTEPHVEKVIEINTELKRKRSSHDSSVTNVDDSTKTDNLDKHVPGNNNKEIFSDSSLVNVTIDVETPPKKRGRGRPRKHFRPVSDKSNEIQNNQIVDVTLADNKSPVKDQNTATEETPSTRSRRGSTNVTKEVSENQNNEGSVTTPRTCTKRASRNSSSHSTSECKEENVKSDISNMDDIDVQCGVCDETVKWSAWMRHIAKAHDYLAWKKGSPRLNLEDELEVKNHLQNILKEMHVLICFKCGIRRKYITSYLKHVKTCDSTEFQDDANVSMGNLNEESIEQDTSLEVSELNLRLKNSQKEIRCGVCSKDVDGRDWIPHIQKEHNYLAWADGQTPLDVNDSAEVQRYLMALAKKLGGLTCYKCRLVRKYANLYLQHVKTCDVPEPVSLVDGTPLIPCRGGNVRCGVCFEEVLPHDWKQHAMKKHYNIAWIEGETPIDVRNFYVVESYLKEYRNRHNNKLTCKICGDSKISCCGFYAHIIQCGKSQEESDKYKELCDICNKKYLCIYKSQHMTMHREKEYAMERKLKLAELKEQSEQPEETTDETPGRRRAAEKAKIVIAQYKDELQANAQKGDTDFTNGYSSDSDVSVKLEQFTDDESDDSDVNSDISEEEHQDMERKRKRVLESNAPAITRIPFPVKNVGSYMQDSFHDLCKNHLTKKRLFPEWSDCEYQKLADDQLKQYMPIMEESCKVKIAQEGWSTYKRFEAIKKEGCVSFFVGGSIQCLSWVPVHLDDITGVTGNFLAVACHSGMDSPRFHCDEAPEHANLLQIWDLGDLQLSIPKLALGLAHDYGTIWAMDWCPSGARDLVKEDDEGNIQKRLGLLAIACSNGTAYIFCVPYPSSIVKDDQLFYKIKPVAELRLSSIVGSEKKYQATSLRWSVQKGHNVVIVGYSEGTLAYFDLSNNSPLLVRKENGVTVINPFYDERSHNSCVTGVDLYAGGDTCWRGGVVSSASSSGARILTGAPTRGSALLSALACAGAYFLPHWPSAVLTAVNSKVNQTVNEVEWQTAGGGWRSAWRSGRRVGGVRARAACAACGALAAAADPLLCVLHPHPAHPDIAKHVAAIIEMSPLAQKRKQTNDELAMKLEPLTYDDAVQKYGIEFELVSTKNKAYQQKALSTPMLHYPERFPLADITSMSFCTAVKHHNYLAVGTHAGIIFLVNA